MIKTLLVSFLAIASYSNMHMHIAIGVTLLLIGIAIAKMPRIAVQEKNAVNFHFMNGQ